MPGFGLGLGLQMQTSCHMQLQCGLQLQLTLAQPTDPDAFRPEGEIEHISQHEILEQLIEKIDNKEFCDNIYFGLEINRTIFGHSLETRLGYFGKDIQQLMEFYDSNEESTKNLLHILGSRKKAQIPQNVEDDEINERQEIIQKQTPGVVAHAWNNINKSYYFKKEKTNKQIFNFLAYLNQTEADIAVGIENLSKVTELKNQRHLVKKTFDKIKSYAQTDTRLITFSKSILCPIVKALKQNKEKLTTNESELLYKNIIEYLFMLDQELRIGDTVEKIADSIKENGIKKLLNQKIPIPLQTYLENIQPNKKTQDKIVNLFNEKEFKQGRELQRKIYKGFSALEELDKGKQILEHIVENTPTSKILSSILLRLYLVHHEPDFEYNFQLENHKKIIRNLKFQLVDKSIKRLNLDDDTLEKYLQRLETDDRFQRISGIITKLASYKHYQNSQQLELLKEITEQELDNNFNKWRYSHDKAQEQLKVLGKDIDEWKNNTQVTRIVGKIEKALNTHVESVKNMLPTIFTIYRDHYGNEFDEPDEDDLKQQISDNEQELKTGNLSKKHKKQIGYKTFLLRERLTYLEFINSLNHLDINNYTDILNKAQEILKKKSKNPVYQNIQCVKETLDQPEYRNSRKIIVRETDDLETMLRFGEIPVSHCQNWKSESSYNTSLLSFVADANKKLYHIINGEDKAISMTIVRLIDWYDNPTILAENVYAREWSEDYGIALFSSLAEKAYSIYEETGKQVRIATNDSRLEKAMEQFAEKYEIEVFKDTIKTIPPESKNTKEYYDFSHRTDKKYITANVKYICFGEQE